MLKMKKTNDYEVIHPCLDNINGKLRLKIFRYMFKEPTLPKYLKNLNAISEDGEWAINALAKNASEFQSNQERKIVEFERSLKLRSKHIDNTGLFGRMFNAVFKRKIDVEKTMSMTKNELSETLDGNLLKAEQGIDNLIKRSIDASQTKLTEELLKYKNVIACQIVLKENGFDKFVQEKSIVKFIKLSLNGVRLDFIRNYTQIIPISVLEIKKKADDLKIFDNYCILYRSEEWESWGSGEIRINEDKKLASKINKEEIERRSKDPILFGMIDGSHRLYYVADWIVDDDDL